MLLVFVFGVVREERLLLEYRLDFFEFENVIKLKGFPSLNGFEKGFAFFHGLLHVLEGKGFEEFVNLKGETMTYVGHKGGVWIVGVVHGIADLIFGHEVVEHGRIRSDYERSNHKKC